MPKLKSHKGAQDRFKFLKSGKILRTHGMKSHLRRNKSKDVRRQFDEMIGLSPADERRIKKLLPYGTR